MAFEEKEREIRFIINSKDTLALDSKGRFHCDICYRVFVVPEVDVMLYGFTICPTCIQNGPQFAIAESKRTAGSKNRLARWEENPEDTADIAEQYLRLAKILRDVKSFYDIPGGAVAIAIAGVKPEDIRRGYRRKAA